MMSYTERNTQYVGKSFGKIKEVVERVSIISIPLRPALAERTFSTMKLIKTYLQTSTTTT